MRFLLALFLVAPASAAPRFFTLDEPSAELGFDLLLSEHFYEESELSGRRIGLFGQIGFDAPGGRHGAYLQTAISQVAFEDESEQGSSRLELGYVYAAPYTGGEAILRFGIVVPGGGDDLAEVLTNALTSLGRLTDFVLLSPDIGWLRLGASPRGDAGALFYQVDVGFDLPVFGDRAENADNFGRLNLALGYETGPADLVVELVNIMYFGDGDLEDRALHTASFGVRGRFKEFQPGVALVRPLDEDAAKDVPWVLQVSAAGSFGTL